MRLTHLRFSSLTSTVAGLLVLAACSDAPIAPTSTDPEVIEETNFASSLNIDLASMTRTASGLYLEDFEEGSGDPAAAGHLVEVSYIGYLSNGSTFDSGQFPFTLGSGQVVAGFDEGVTGMRVEGVRRMIIPPSLAYGNTQRGNIPPGSILIFDVGLESINSVAR